MLTIDIDTNGPAVDDYRGCGKAWVAVKDNAVIAIRYMERLGIGNPDERSAAEIDGLPQWVAAILSVDHIYFDREVSGCRGSLWLAAIAEAADAAPDCPRPPRRERYRPTELVRLADLQLGAIDAALFGDYRERMLAELAELGEVRSCMISCWQAVFGARTAEPK